MDPGDEGGFAFVASVLLSSDVTVGCLTVGESKADLMTELGKSISSLGSSQKSLFSVLDLDVTLSGDLSLVSDGNVVDVEVVLSREEDTLVEAHFKSSGGYTSQPVVDELF